MTVDLIMLALAFALGALVAAPVAVVITKRRMSRYGVPAGAVVGVIRHRPRSSEIYVSLVEVAPSVPARNLLPGQWREVFSTFE